MKYLFTLTVLFFLVNGNKSFSQLRGNWHFDENTGTSSADNSGNNNNATLNNAGWTTGVYGSAVNFTSSNSSVTFPAGLSGSGFPARGTVAFWIKGDFSTQNQLTVFDSYRNADHIFIRTGSNVNQLQIVFQRSTGNYAELYTFPIAANIWTQVAVSWDTLNHSAFIYKDGALVESHAIVNNWFNGSGDPIINGWSPSAQSFALGQAGSSFIGAIDEFILSQTPLSPVQIQQLYSNTILSPFDLLPPSAPAGVGSSAISSNTTRTSWVAANESGSAGIAGYLVLRNGVAINTVGPSAGGYTNFTGLTANTAYQYGVYAFDYNGNRSSVSNIATATTSSAKTAFLSDFESEIEDPAAVIYPWGQQGANDSSIYVTTERSRAGNKSVRFSFKKSEWSSGNPEVSSTSQNLRAEILPDAFGPKNLTLNTGWWLGFSEFIPADWQKDLTDNAESVWQFHGAVNGPSAGSPPLSAVIVGDSLLIETRTGTNPTINGERIVIAGAIPIPKGVWSDWVINCRFDYTNGYIKVWRNGRLVANYSGPTLYQSIGQTNQNGPYLKLGIYKWFWGSTPSVIDQRILYADEVRSGATNARFADVNPVGAHDSAYTDIVPPIITLNGNDSITIPQNTPYNESGASAFDAEDGVVSVTLTGSVNSSVPGNYTIVYSAKDLSGNTTVRRRYIHVTDLTAPDITLMGSSVITMAYGNPFTDPGATAFDETDGSLTVQTSGTVNTNALGSYTIIYTATDLSGNAAQAIRTVTVVDQDSPVITLTGSNPITIAWGSTFSDPGAMANDAVDGAITVTISGAVNSSVVGTYTITYSAVDNSGNNASQTRTVYVTDQTPPVITLNGANPMTVAHGSTFTDPVATATDAVDGTVAITTSGTVNTSVIGSYTLTYTATDNAGNSASKTRTVSVTDQTAPVITIAGANPMTVAHGSVFTDPGASATDAVDGAVTVTKAGTVNTSIIGNYTLTYTATDAGNSTSKTRTVTVTDQTAPVITIAGANPMTVAHGSTFTDPGASATDAVDGAVTVTKAGTVNTSIIGSYTLTYTVTDNAGNSASKTRIVSVTDQTAPVITIVGANPMTVAHGSTFTDPGATASDAVDGTVTVTKTGTVNTSSVGTYTLTYTATDNAGNSVSKTRTVSVTDQTAPVITIAGANPMTVAHGSTFSDPGATATDAVDGAVAVTKSGTVNTSVIGSYILTYTATDHVGNTTSKTRTVTVTDQTAPVITITGANPMTVAQGSTFTDPGATATDAVDGAVAVTKTGSVNTAVIGTYTIIYSAKDKVNNSSSSNRTVYVKDLTAPVISNIVATVTKSSATITWTTNEKSNSLVNYGLTTSYESTTTVSDAAGVTSHTVTISGLTSCKNYSFQVVSVDAAANTGTSTNQGFKTACK